MTRVLEERARKLRARLAVRAWEYRQRHNASGVWFRLRRVLAEAEEAYAISEADAEHLVREGCTPEPVGAELEPRKTLLFVAPERLAGLQSRAPLRVALDAKMLGARCIALVRFRALR
jgi:hypothetical protein